MSEAESLGTSFSQAQRTLRRRGVAVADLVPTIIDHGCMGFSLWITDVSGPEPRHLGRISAPTAHGLFPSEAAVRKAILLG